MLNLVRLFSGVALIGSLLGGSVACTAARTGIQLQAALDAKAVAIDKQAPELAPYEYSMADRYLRKAWEEAGHGEHRSSVILAKKSMEWTDQALVQIGKGPRRLDVTAPIERPEPATSTPRELPGPPPAPVSLEGDDDIVLEGP